MEQVFPFHTKVFSGCNSGKLIETTGSNSPTDHHECKVKVDETKPFIEILMYESTEYKNNWPDKGLLKTVEKVEIHEEDIVLEEDADVKAIEGIGSPRCIKDEASDEWDKEIKLKIETSEVNYFKKVGEEKQIKKTDDVIGEVIKSEETEFELVEEFKKSGTHRKQPIGPRPKPQKNPIVCHVCGKTFTKKITLKYHEVSHTKKYRFLCPFCGKPFARRTLLAMHELVHTNEKPHECPTCNKRFARKWNLTHHRRKAHATGRSFACETCNKTFPERITLKRHALSHLPKAPQRTFSCSACGKLFDNNRSFAGHVRSHTKELLFDCVVCGARFGHKSTLYNHLRCIHTVETSLGCGTCGEVFVRQQDLVLHVKGVHERGVYECSACKRRFTYKQNLVKHEKTCVGIK